MCIILHESSSQACYVLWKTWLSLKKPQMMTMAFSITDSRKKQDVSESKYQKNIIFKYTYIWKSIQTFIKLFNLIISSDHTVWNSIKTHTNFALWWQHFDFFHLQVQYMRNMWIIKIHQGKWLLSHCYHSAQSINQSSLKQNCNQTVV